MINMIESICALCMIGAFFDLLHKGGRFYRVLSLTLGLKMISLLIEGLSGIL